MWFVRVWVRLVSAPHQFETHAPQPEGYHVPEPIHCEAVELVAAHAVNGDEPGVAKHGDVACDGWPCMREPRREIACGEASAPRGKHLQDVPSSGVCQGFEHGVDVMQVLQSLGQLALLVICHTSMRSRFSNSKGPLSSRA